MTVVRTEVIHLDDNLIRPGEIRCQLPADAAGTACARAGGAAIGRLRDGGVVAGAAVPGAGGQARAVAGAVLGERRGVTPAVAAGGGGIGGAFIGCT